MKEKYAVDTNVAICANLRNTHVGMECQLSTINMLDDITGKHIVLVDELGEILLEYAKHLNFRGEPGVGDAFYKHVFNSQYNERKVKRVGITASNDQKRGYEELPSNNMDPSDRKFLAVAVSAGGKIVNASDSDWLEISELCEVIGVSVIELCVGELKIRA